MVISVLVMKNMKPPADMPEGAKRPPEGGFSKTPNKAGTGDAPLIIVVSCSEGSEFDAVSAATGGNAFDEVVTVIGE